MKPFVFLLMALLASTLVSHAVPRIDEDAFGKSLGGWKKGPVKTVDYALSGATYRTYKPEVSPTPDGGIFVSLRIDNVRGWLSNNDHAVLEVTVNAKGIISSAQSNIAIQGRSISSDVIRGGTEAGQRLAGVDRAVQIGTDLVADLSSKLLQEKIVEAGRVSFPSALRHNYNLLFQAIRTEPVPAPVPAPVPDQATPPPSPSTPPVPPGDDHPKAIPAPADASSPPPNKVEIKPYGAPKVDLPVPN